MSLRRHALLLAATTPLSLPACSGPPPEAAEGNQVGSLGGPATEVAPSQALPSNAADDPAAAAPTQDYAGKWVGVEGMVLEVTAKPGGGVTIVNQWNLDNKGTFDGTITPEGVRFVRSGKTVVAKPTNGDATGLKYLAGKQQCLTVAEGEGYCRD